MQISNIPVQQTANIPQIPIVDGVQAVNTNVYGGKKADTNDSANSDKNGSGHRSAKRVEEQVDKWNQGAEQNQRSLRYAILEKPRTVILQIVDNSSGKVLDEIPSEKMVKLVAAMEKASSKILDQTV